MANAKVKKYLVLRLISIKQLQTSHTNLYALIKR